MSINAYALNGLKFDGHHLAIRTIANHLEALRPYVFIYVEFVMI